ncbi:hypothetical protein [Yersinia ruckeri]|uniref:Uncharacterized protein n=1 Tax=Yersinia ruckeri TaxID=29486 RepID=A0A0A8VI06_YERRU|nr:hypothetical protein [Yersinia ruckeri]EKN4687141.1 hypothetical protein [Yersinia ruckeri]UIM98744.1 hypothetical protein LGL89_06580 [Yersinia ruckeri]UZX67306.1 hypothetical protein ND437_09885 [Yersinia ruckeri]CEK27206.1 hypothetical protein CSF007_7250 [Yersinia ruckeri]
MSFIQQKTSAKVIYLLPENEDCQWVFSRPKGREWRLYAGRNHPGDVL